MHALDALDYLSSTEGEGDTVLVKGQGQGEGEGEDGGEDGGEVSCVFPLVVSPSRSRSTNLGEGEGGVAGGSGEKERDFRNLQKGGDGYVVGGTLNTLN